MKKEAFWVGEYLFDSQDIIKAYMDCVGDRAKWFAYIARHTPKEIFDEAAPKAIWEFGYDKGRVTPGPRGNIHAFERHFNTGYNALPCNNTNHILTEEKAVIRFVPCPLVEAWKEIGCTKEEIAHYCDLICSGDYGHAEATGLTAVWKKLVSHGDDYCEIELTVKK